MEYLDHNATTPLAPEAREAMLPFLEGEFGNPSSIHAAGRRARAAVDDSRDRLAAILGALEPAPSEDALAWGNRSVAGCREDVALPFMRDVRRAG